MTIGKLSSLLYEAALVPERWTDFLEAAAVDADAMGGTLFTLGHEKNHGIVSGGLQAIWADFIAGGWDAINPASRRVVELGITDFVHDYQLFTPEEILAHPWYRVFCARWNMGGSLGASFSLPSGAQLLFTLERSRDVRPYDSTDVAQFAPMRADLGRAVDLSSRLLFQQYQTTTTVLNAVGLAAAVIDRKGTLLSANSLFEELMPGLVQDRGGKLTLAAKGADALLKDAIDRLSPEFWVGSLGSIPIPSQGELHGPAVLHLAPIRGMAHDIMVGGACLVVVTTLKGEAVPTDAFLRNLFDLTGAEAKVARALIANNGNHPSVAKDLNISYETVRTHSKAIYQKTGISSVGELIAMSGRLNPFPK